MAWARRPFTGDVAIAGERIAEVGGKQGPGRREIDARGLLVTPGWVDAHTHYDGQAMWDPLLSPSCWHGVTTAIFGNCGVGFAPVRREHRAALMDLMEGVEEIPGVVLADGLSWDWESFPDFLDALERRPRAINIAAQIAHLPLRVYVMGDRAVRFEGREPTNRRDAPPDRRGVAGRRLWLHHIAHGFAQDPDGDMVPSRYAGSEELVGIGRALGDVGAGAFGMNSDFDDESRSRLDDAARKGNGPAGLVPADRPLRGSAALAAFVGRRARRARRGREFDRPDRGRPIGVMIGIGTALNPFTVRPSYRELDGLSIPAQLERLRDPELRREFLPRNLRRTR